jgi:hypothetical protein
MIDLNMHQIEIERSIKGEFRNGRFVNIEVKKIKSKACIQPEKNENIRTYSTTDALDIIKIYTKFELKVKSNDEINHSTADIVIVNSKKYEIKSVLDYTKTPIPHYEGIGVRIF